MLAAVVVGTWNGNWFPSGRAEHRAHPDVEEATSKAAAAMLARGLAKADPEGTNDVVLCLHEMRGPRAASNPGMADGFSREKMKKYTAETDKYLDRKSVV